LRILIIEDELKTAEYLRKGLAENGFAVDVERRGDDGLRTALTHPFDLIVLDVMLPARDGWEVLTELRAAGLATPVLFLTARDAVADRVRGLNLGADDYLVKPFSFSELLARVRGILRRDVARGTDVLRVADLTLDPIRHTAERAERRLDLSAKEFQLLGLLMRHHGEVLSRTIIAERVWDINFDCDSNVIDVAIRRLRRKVDDSFARKLIHTVRGVGYVLEAR